MKDTSGLQEQRKSKDAITTIIFSFHSVFIDSSLPTHGPIKFGHRIYKNMVTSQITMWSELVTVEDPVAVQEEIWIVRTRC